MAKGKQKQAARTPSGYELLGGRIQRLIATPLAQLARAVTIRRQDDEAQSDWDQLIDDLRSTEGLDVSEGDDGSVTLRWEAQAEAW
ncbi:hypothetical protein D3C76_538250 [compost metagenome]